MSPRDLLERCRLAGITLTVAGERLAYRSPVGALTAELLDGIKANKATLMTIIGDGQAPGEKTWPCPECGEAVRVLYGFTSHVACKPCWAAQNPARESHWPSPVRTTQAAPCPGCGSRGPSPPACPRCGMVSNHPPSLDHDGGPAWWCRSCLNAQVVRARRADPPQQVQRS